MERPERLRIRRDGAHRVETGVQRRRGHGVRLRTQPRVGDGAPALVVAADPFRLAPLGPLRLASLPCRIP